MKVRDLEALAAACARLGLELRRGQTTYRWYGTWVNDYHGDDAAYMHGIKPEDYGKCAHAIAIPGDEKAYEIGLVEQADGFRLVWDFYGPLGDRITQKVGGQGCGRLLQAYALEKAKLEARRKGYSVTEMPVAADGSIRLRITAGS